MAPSTRRRFASSSAMRIRGGSSSSFTARLYTEAKFTAPRSLGDSHHRISGRRAAPHLGKCVGFNRQKDRKGGALARLRPHLDGAAVVLDDPLGDRQSEPRALLFGRVKRDEQVLQVP